MKKWQTGMHNATDCIIFTRTDGEDGSAVGITCFIVPADAHGINVESKRYDPEQYFLIGVDS